MDSLITAAAYALAAGDVLGALKRVATRDDAPALALRGIAMARLGDFTRARTLLKSAARAFGSRETVARARCLVAEAEIALVSRDLGWRPNALKGARATLDRHGDRVNAAHARNIEARRLLLVGRIDEAAGLLATHEPLLPPATRAGRGLVEAGIAIRRLETKAARAALDRAAVAAREAGIPALMAEVDAAITTLNTPAARLIAHGVARPLLIDEVEVLLGSDALVVDACRNVVRNRTTVISLATRPVLFALLRCMAEAWPGGVSREALLLRGFGARHADESHRARLRVEIGRLRTEIAMFAEVTATDGGFRLSTRAGCDVVVLAPPADDRHQELLALLADGQSWSSSALAIALGASPRTVQRALEELSRSGKVQSHGRGRAIRWMAATVPGFPTSLLLPGSLATG
ncbi:MAG: helix-turn-helix domain-containing protein [Rhizobiaceae bacterium]|nr:helix-turn-helix domain-containing protein [Rhizobiaceae bacterium]MCV0408331.1 helix-turn-helix domain-containing protein [Rhizobiaceae bacterium]